MSFGLRVSPDQQAEQTRIDEEMYGLVTELTNEINWLMRERGLTRADLAARMGVSPGQVSQILGGGENLTLRTLAALSPRSTLASASSSTASRWRTRIPRRMPRRPPP